VIGPPETESIDAPLLIQNCQRLLPPAYKTQPCGKFRLARTPRYEPAPPVGLAQTSTEKRDGLSAATYGTLTYWVEPLNETAVSESPAMAPGWSSVGLLT
jgi:hypothetical protein